MPQPSRPYMKAQLRREVLVEAGHRCAIPTCRQVPIEVHHIDGDRTNHSFENLIALCRNDHGLAEDGKIDRKALRMYKHNLAIITGRYGDLERRLLDYFVENPEFTAIVVNQIMDFEFLYLIQDGLLMNQGQRVVSNISGYTQGPVQYGLTDQGQKFVERLREGREVEA
jgi:hypothetical protein